jgi:hypothetical protein
LACVTERSLFKPIAWPLVVIEQPRQHIRFGCVDERGKAGDIGEDDGDVMPVNAHTVAVILSSKAFGELHPSVTIPG